MQLDKICIRIVKRNVNIPKHDRRNIQATKNRGAEA